MKDAGYDLLDRRLRAFVEHHASSIPGEALDHVNHYLDSAELEMACESFVLSLVERGVELTNDSRRELSGLALALGLDKESVFSADFSQVTVQLLGWGRDRGLG